MPFDFELDQSKRIVLSRAWGELTDEDLLAHLGRVSDAFEQGRLDPTWGQIADFSRVQSVERVSTQGIREMAKRNPWPPESPRVLIVPSDVQYGLARIYQAMGEAKTENVALVRSEVEAMKCIEKARGHRPEAT